MSGKGTDIEKLTIHKNGGSRVITDDHEIASEFNKFFVDIGKKTWQIKYHRMMQITLHI